MARPQFMDVSVDDPATSRFQDNVRRCVEWLLDRAVERVVMRDVVLASGDNKIEHPLGRKPESVTVRTQTAAATVRFNRKAATTTNRTIVVNASGAVTADLELE